MAGNPIVNFIAGFLERLSKTIRTKVLLFEVVLILFAAGSVGSILTWNTRKILVRKAHVLCERVARDLAGAVEFDSMSGTDAAVNSFKGMDGVVYLGYYGNIVVANGVKRVHLYVGEPPSETYLRSVLADPAATNFTRSAGVVKFISAADTNNVRRRDLKSGYEYVMPVVVKELGNRRIGTVVLRYSYAPIRREIVRMRNLILLITLLVIALSIYASVRGSDEVVRPILDLTDGVKRFGAGDMKVRIEIGSRDELGVLAGAFNGMVVSIREKLEMQKFVSGSTVKMIERSVSASKDVKVSHRENAALFFSDIRGFTAMSEKLDPQEVVDMLNLYLDFQTGIIREQNGDIDKYVGDEIVAVFTGEGMCGRAVESARRIQNRIREVNAGRVREGKSPVEVGIGIHYGEVVMGSIGSHDRMDYTVIGDNVNLAARLCSAAKAGQILVSKDVYANLADKAGIEKLEAITVKGKSKPIEVYRTGD